METAFIIVIVGFTFALGIGYSEIRKIKRDLYHHISDRTKFFEEQKTKRQKELEELELRVIEHLEYRLHQMEERFKDKLE